MHSSGKNLLRKARMRATRARVPSLKMQFLDFYRDQQFSDIKLEPIHNLALEVPVDAGENFQFWIESVSSSPEVTGAALVKIECLDDSGEVIRILDWPHKSSLVGDYIYIESGPIENPKVTHAAFRVPANATLIRLTGRQWKADIETLVLGAVEYLPGPTPGALQSGTPLSIPYENYDFSENVDPGAQQVKVDITVAPGTGTNLPLKVQLFDSAGAEMLSPANLPHHAVQGAFINCHASRNSKKDTSAVIDLPEGVAQIRVSSFANWSAKGSILGAPHFEYEFHRTVEQVFNSIEALPAEDKEQPLIFIDSTAPPLGHQTLAIRPNNLAQEFCNAGATVVYMPFSSLQEHENIVDERLVQFPRNDFHAVVDQLLKLEWQGPKVYYCTSFPDWNAASVIDRFNRNGWTTVYEIRDNMEEFKRVGYSKWYDPSLEVFVAQRADAIITVSGALARKMEAVAHPDRQPRVIPNGVRAELADVFSEYRSLEQIAERQPLKVVGYVGHLTPAWFNWQYVIAAAKALPDYTFEIVGHGAPDNLITPDNLKILGPKNHEELEAIMPRWKVALIPFVDSPLTRGVDPNKIYEYLACANRVVSAEMGSVSTYPATTVYDTLESFIDQIRLHMEAEWTQEELNSVEVLVEDSKWSSRAKQVLNFINEIGKED